MRVRQMMEMDAVMRSINNEDYSDEWLMVGVPDGCTMEQYIEIAEEDDMYRDISREFLRICTALYATADIYNFAYVKEAD